MTKTLKYQCSYCTDKAPELGGCPCVVEISEKWANKMNIILKCPIRSNFDKVDFKLKESE